MEYTVKDFQHIKLYLREQYLKAIMLKKEAVYS